MKIFFLAVAVLLLAGCRAAPDALAPGTSPAASGQAGDAKPAAVPPPAGEARRASATGVVQTVDAPAQLLVIAHGPVESLGWPGMTMTFRAPGVDLSAIKAGDAVSFEFTSTGMDGTITSISKQ